MPRVEELPAFAPSEGMAHLKKRAGTVQKLFGNRPLIFFARAFRASIHAGCNGCRVRRDDSEIVRKPLFR